VYTSCILRVFIDVYQAAWSSADFGINCIDSLFSSKLIIKYVCRSANVCMRKHRPTSPRRSASVSRGHRHSATHGNLAVPRSRMTKYGQRIFTVSRLTLANTAADRAWHWHWLSFVCSWKQCSFLHPYSFTVRVLWHEAGPQDDVDRWGHLRGRYRTAWLFRARGRVDTTSRVAAGPDRRHRHYPSK